MASANEPGVVKVVAVDPNGRENDVFTFRSDGPVAAGFSPDGVLANKTADKQLHVGLGGPVLTTGWKVGLRFKLDAAEFS